MSEKDYTDYINDIKQSIMYIQEFSKDNSFEDFQKELKKSIK